LAKKNPSVQWSWVT